jgi:hypothetical protein
MRGGMVWDRHVTPLSPNVRSLGEPTTTTVTGSRRVGVKPIAVPCGAVR